MKLVLVSKSPVVQHFMLNMLLIGDLTHFLIHFKYLEFQIETLLKRIVSGRV